MAQPNAGPASSPTCLTNCLSLWGERERTAPVNMVAGCVQCVLEEACLIALMSNVVAAH